MYVYSYLYYKIKSFINLRIKRNFFTKSVTLILTCPWGLLSKLYSVGLWEMTENSFCGCFFFVRHLLQQMINMTSVTGSPYLTNLLSSFQQAFNHWGFFCSNPFSSLYLQSTVSLSYKHIRYIKYAS